jgi:hypothetical protein
MTRDLIIQLRVPKGAASDVSLVDVIDNGGGTEWAEAAVRMVTGIRLKAERIAFVRGPQWANSFALKEGELRAAARGERGPDHFLLMSLADQVAAKRRDAESSCDSAPMWRGEHPSCRWLGEGFYSSSLLDSGNPDQLRNRPWERTVYKLKAALNVLDRRQRAIVAND